MAVRDVNSMVKGMNLRDPEERYVFAPFGKCNGTSPWDQNQPGEAGYRCFDQPDAGISNDMPGADMPPPVWVGNIKKPCYVWNNTKRGRRA